MFARPLRVLAVTFGIAAPHADAQVVLSPTTIQPAAWERFALRVVNQTEVPTVRVTVMVPQALAVLGADAPAGWRFHLDHGSDSTPQYVEWSGDSLLQWQFREFPILARLAADADDKDLVFPVTVTKADGTELHWNRGPVADAPPPVVRIVGTTQVTGWGAIAMAGAAVGIAILALALAVGGAQRRAGGPGGGSPKTLTSPKSGADSAGSR